MDPVAIVGGGVVGTSVAAHLAERDVPVRLYERDALGAGTTAKSMAIFFWHQDDPSATEHRFRARAWETYEPLIEAGDLDFTEIGTLETAPELTDVPAVRERWTELNDLGVETTWLEPADLAEKGLNPDAFEGALFVPADGYLDGGEIVAHFAQRAREAGATIETDTAVTAVETAAGAVETIETTAGTHAVSGVVNAAGPWAPEINDFVGLDQPLRHTRGPIVVLSREEPTDLPFVILRDELYFREDGVSQAFGGRFDTTYETAGHLDPDANQSVEQAFTLDVADEIEAAVPELADARIVDDWVGFRTITPDGRPLVGETAVEGFYAAVGMSGYGVTRAPAVGEILAGEIVGEPVDAELAAWVAADRFD